MGTELGTLSGKRRNFNEFDADGPLRAYSEGLRFGSGSLRIVFCVRIVVPREGTKQEHSV